MTTELYANPILFNRELAKRCEEYNYDKSNQLSRWSFADTDGVIFESQCAVHLFEKLNKRFGNFIDTERSIARRRMYVITYLDEKPLSQDILSEDVEKPLVAVVTESVVEQEYESSTPLISLVAEDEAPVEKQFSLEYAQSLYIEGNEMTSRKKLEDYGRELGVELKRNKKFVNMLSTLEEKASAK
tara:strand:+ start:1192 stop:1749 length:558 start_codon:yes stop_codon:yes gene_type:complete